MVDELECGNEVEEVQLGFILLQAILLGSLEMRLMQGNIY
jgi:hypothetical protein